MNIKSTSILNKIIPIILFQKFNSEISLLVRVQNLLISLVTLKKSILYQFSLLTAVSGVDYYNNKYRFNVTYELLSLVYNTRVRVKVFLTEIDSVPSVVSIFKNANWWEREIWDLYGIFFSNHPDLRRILTDYGFEGHPMRKDFPVYGYVEVFYDSIQKRIIIESLELSQEYRVFSFDTPW
jgi:NADH/F420H2 dehydrogenase subunit C